MEKILITGATGFVGSHLTEICVEKGFDVVAFDRYNPNHSLGWLEKSKYIKDINFKFGDIRDYDTVLKNIKAYRKFIKTRLLRTIMESANEILPMLLFLCSKLSSMMGGCLVPIDAGEGKAYQG